MRISLRQVISALVVFALAMSLPQLNETATASPYLPLTGLLHTHTGYSDGQPGTTPSDAYASAATNGLSFAAVTEHSEAYPVPITASEACLPHEGGTLVECALADDPESSIDASISTYAAQDVLLGSSIGTRGLHNVQFTQYGTIDNPPFGIWECYERVNIQYPLEPVVQSPIYCHFFPS